MAATTAPKNRNKEELWLLLFLWIQIDFVKQRGTEEFCDTDAEALADLMDDPQFDGIVSTVHDVAQGGFGNAAFDEKLVLSHVMFCQKLIEPDTDCLIELHYHHRPSRKI